MVIEIRGLKELLKAFQDAGVKAPDQFRRAMVKSVVDIQGTAREEVPEDTGELRRSITVDVSTQPLIGKVMVGQPYGKYVEYGTRPHYISAKSPAGQNIKRWAGRKGIPYLAVLRSIARKGTRAQPYMQPAFTRNVRNVQGHFERAVQSVVNILGGK